MKISLKSKIMLTAALILAATVLSCSLLAQQESVEIAVDLPARASVPAFLPYKMRVIAEGPDMPRKEAVFSMQETTLPPVRVTAGPDRHFIVEALDIDNSIMYRGEARLNIFPGEPVVVRINMQLDPYWAPSVYVNDSVAISGDGTFLAPFKTIGEALTYITASSLNTNGPVNIKVAAGTYNEQVILIDNVRLLGGYSEDFKTRRFISPQDRENPAYKTTVTFDTTGISNGVLISNTNTEISGFTIINTHTSASAAEQVYGILAGYSNTNILSNTILIGSSTDYNKGIKINAPSGINNIFVISNYIDTTDTSNTNSLTYGLELSLGSNCDNIIIANNAIKAYTGIVNGDDSAYTQNVYMLNNTMSIQTGISNSYGTYTHVINNIINQDTSFSSIFSINSGNTANIKNNYIASSITDSSSLTLDSSNIRNTSSPISFDSFLKPSTSSDNQIFSGGMDTSPLIETLVISQRIKELLYRDITGIPRGPVWSIGAYQQ